MSFGAYPINNKDRRSVYKAVQIGTGVARGLWIATYAWFLSTYIALSPAEIGIVFAVGFGVQFLTEVPSGALAERYETRRLMLASFLCSALYAGTYSYLSYAQPTAILLWACTAEVFFGLGQALLSGTMDAWVIEGERERFAGSTPQLANKDDSSFREPRTAESESIKESAFETQSQKQFWIYFFQSVLGAVAFGLIALDPSSVAWLWLAAALVYLTVPLMFYRRMSTGTASATGKRSASAGAMRDTGRFADRAFEYLRESPGTARLFVQGGFAFVLFWSNQAFWIAFATQAVGLDTSEGVSVSFAFLPAIGLAWVAGEGLSALGGRSGSARLDAAVAVSLAFYAVGVLCQVGSLLVAREGEIAVNLRFLLFGFGYSICKYFEGRVRRDLGVMTDLSVVSERATLLSLDSLIKSLMGMGFLLLVGGLVKNDPVSGYLLVCVTAACGAAMFALSDFGRKTLAAASEVAHKEAGSLRTTSTGGGRVVLMACLVLALASAFLYSQPSGKIWSDLSPGLSVDAELLEEIAPERRAEFLSRDSSRAQVAHLWRLRIRPRTREAEEGRADLSTAKPVVCAVRFNDPAAAEVVAHEGASNPELNITKRAATYRFEILHGRDVEVRLPISQDVPFRCTSGDHMPVPVRSNPRGLGHALEEQAPPLVVMVAGLAGFVFVLVSGMRYRNQFGFELLKLRRAVSQTAPPNFAGPQVLAAAGGRSRSLHAVAKHLEATDVLMGGWEDDGRRRSHAWCVRVQESENLTSFVPSVKSSLTTVAPDSKDDDARTPAAAGLKRAVEYAVLSHEILRPGSYTSWLSSNRGDASLSRDVGGFVISHASSDDSESRVPLQSTEVRLWPLTPYGVDTSLSGYPDKLEGFVGVSFVVQETPDRAARTVCFSMVVFGHDRASRFVNALEREVLRGLANGAAVDHHLCKLALDEHLRLHGTNRVVSNVLISMDDAVREGRGIAYDELIRLRDTIESGLYRPTTMALGDLFSALSSCGVFELNDTVLGIRVSAFGASAIAEILNEWSSNATRYGEPGMRTVQVGTDGDSIRIVMSSPATRKEAKGSPGMAKVSRGLGTGNLILGHMVDRLDGRTIRYGEDDASGRFVFEVCIPVSSVKVDA
ncbi:MAG: MFS transporter [Sandaracinus sp.]|nr:MFS transporter [Sandaracinus sp.]MCB9615983.1 MFS transporter [Sandaracinus sp.]MCB9621856.1 MFS transporter [Sandaracinus sp.]MCB9630749.1 MFS transporter [Sandaracinus sp.]